MGNVVYVGIDVHQSFVVLSGVGERGWEELFRFRVENDYERLGRQVRRLDREWDLRCCYEASSCGLSLYRWFRSWGISCVVIAPSLTPRRPGDRVKTDYRDAFYLALCLRAGMLTLVHVRGKVEEEERSLVRCREAMQREVVRSRQYLLKFLQRCGLAYTGGSNWTQKHWRHLRGLHFEGAARVVYEQYLALLDYKLSQLAELDRQIEVLALSERYGERVGYLCCFRGISRLTAIIILTEVGDFERFASAPALMSYLGLTPSEHSSGESRWRGSITKAGNGHVRRALVEASWHYRHRPAISERLKKAQRGQPAPVVASAWKAQQRLYKRFWRLLQRKERNEAVVAVARELIGFIWGVMHPVKS